MHQTGSLLAQGHTTTKAKGQDLILDLLLYSPISFLILPFLPDGILVSEHPLSYVHRLFPFALSGSLDSILPESALAHPNISEWNKGEVRLNSLTDAAPINPL